MSKKRLSDTKAIVDEPFGAVHHSVSTRQIANGTLVCESGPEGYKETFHKEAPRIIPARVARGESPDSGNSNSASAAVDWMNKS